MPNNHLVLTKSQQHAFLEFNNFLEKDGRVFILKGYAGTGKTTLMQEFIKELEKRDYKFVLLASTGRAAKILGDITERESCTVHSHIYKFIDFNQDLDEVQRKQKKEEDSGQLLLDFALADINNDTTQRKRFYFVDESSMIADVEDKMPTQAKFGSGRLLKDLLKYDEDGHFIFIGDECQLPPINQSISCALSTDYFKDEYHIEAKEASLTEIVRQAEGNDIVQAAKEIRDLYANPPSIKWAKFPLRGFRNISIKKNQEELLVDYAADIKKYGYEHSTLLCRSNKRCEELTSFIRTALGLSEKTIQKKDLMLVTQNNYLSGLVNGDLVEILSVGNREQRAGLTFVSVEVREIGTKKRYSQLMLEDVVYSGLTNINQCQQKNLFMDFHKRMKAIGIPQKSPDYKLKMMKDPYLNALRCVFGFALTCHKAQGGEWEEVYLDIPRNLPFSPDKTAYQWLYTAVTRAKKTLYVIDDFWVGTAKECMVQGNHRSCGLSDLLPF
jgi:ATP-dependent exoDNAse (exonuclease V) alpha subunit